MKTSRHPPADLHALASAQNCIAVLWSPADVQTSRPDLTADQAWKVLQQAERQHDAEVGINWDVLRWHADDLFPLPS